MLLQHCRWQRRLRWVDEADTAKRRKKHDRRRSDRECGRCQPSSVARARESLRNPPRANKRSEAKHRKYASESQAQVWAFHRSQRPAAGGGKSVSHGSAHGRRRPGPEDIYLYPRSGACSIIRSPMSSCKGTADVTARDVENRQRWSRS